MILDACRYGELRNAIADTAIVGDLQNRNSMGSCTREFITANFVDR